MSTRKIWIARSIAVVVDGLQIVAFPAFAEGFLTPLDVGLDIATAIIMIALLGWHIAFVPTFIFESLPFADLAPSWTIAVLIVTRKTSLVPRTSGPAKPVPSKVLSTTKPGESV